MITTLPKESNHLMKEIKFDLKESFEIQSNEQNFLLNISLNEKLIFFEIEEKIYFQRKNIVFI
jgi:hypothetical protein